MVRGFEGRNERPISLIVNVEKRENLEKKVKLDLLDKLDLLPNLSRTARQLVILRQKKRASRVKMFV